MVRISLIFNTCFIHKISFKTIGLKITASKHNTVAMSIYEFENGNSKYVMGEIINVSELAFINRIQFLNGTHIAKNSGV